MIKIPSLDVAINALRAKHGAQQFDTAVKKIKRGAAGVDKSLAKNNKSMNRFGAGMGKMVVGMVGIAAAYKGLAFAKSAVREFAAFEQQLANISTMLDDQTMRFLPGYKTQLASLAVEFGQTTDTLSKGLYDILSASIGASDAIGVLKVASKAAIGGLTDTATAADAITTIMNSYGYEAEDAAKISDILFATVKGGKITFGELAGSIGKVVSIAASAGLEFEQVSAVIATMTRNGIQADMAMTSLKAIITGFIKPTTEGIIAAEKFGLVLSANTLSTIGLTGAMELLANATAEETAAIFPNVRALLGSEATRKNVIAMIKDHEKALNSAGAAEVAYAKNANTTTMALDKNRELWKGIKRDLIEGIIPEVNQWLQGMSLLASEWKIGWRSMVDEQKNAQAEINAMLEEPDIITKWEFQREGGIDEANALVKAAKEFAAIQKDIRSGADVSLAVAAPEKKTQETIDEAAAAEEAAARRTEAARRMFDDMDSRGEASYQNRKQLLQNEYDDYNTYVTDKLLLDEWYAEQQAELELQKRMSGDDFQTGFTASIEQMQQQTLTWGEIGAQSAQKMQTSFGTAVKSMIMNGATLKEAMHGFAMSMLASFVDVITQMIAMKVMAAAFGVGPITGGGFIGPPAPSAKGNIFSGGVRPFAKGDILTSPTLFPMSNGGIGLGGEAGAEAIMPLGRDNQGRLGVRADGEGGGGNPIKIINVMDQSQVQEYLNSGDGERTIVNIMRRNANEIQDVVG